MSERERKILENWEKILPGMNEEELERLANFTEGAAAMCTMMNQAKSSEQAEA